MRAKVKEAYTDRETGEVRYKGDEVELTAARLAELAARGFVEALEGEGAAEPPAAEGPEAAGEGRSADPDLASMTNAQLREYIEERGEEAPRKANKAALLMIAEAL